MDLEANLGLSDKMSKEIITINDQIKSKDYYI